MSKWGNQSARVSSLPPCGDWTSRLSSQGRANAIGSVFAVSIHIFVAGIAFAQSTDSGSGVFTNPGARGGVQAESSAEFKRYVHFDLPGNDIAFAKGSSLDACLAACSDKSDCQAFTFDRWNRFCSLKNGVSVLTLNPKSVAGVRDRLPAPDHSMGMIQIDRYQGKSFPYAAWRLLNNVSITICEAACRAETTCVAYTFWKGEAICKLFDDPEEYFTNAAADSGIKSQK